MQKLKLCHVTLGLFPDHRDGSASFARGVYDELKTRGHDITCLTAKWGDGFDDPKVITIDVPNSRFLWMPQFLLKFRTYLKKNDFDIIHGNGSRGSLPIMYSGKNYITNIHDLGPFEAQFTKIPIVKWIERKNAKQAKRIITCSDIVRYGIRDYMGAELEKMHCVYSAIDPKFKPMPKEAAEIRETLGIKGPVLYYVGRLAFYKGIDHIIEAYYEAKKKIPDLNLLIGGKPELKLKDTVEGWKRDYPEVNFLGAIPDEEMAAYYSMADAFITYSYASEGFGLTPVEALACGTPVICSTMPAYKEVLEDHATFVEPQQPKALADTLITFFKDIDKGKLQAKEAQDFIKRYTWSAVGDRVEQVYEGYLQEFSKS